MLKGIKDGKLFSSKYDSQKVRINTPNIVMVFGNDEPKGSLEAILNWKWSSKRTHYIRYCKDGLTIKNKLEEEGVCNGECIAQCIV